MRGLKEEELVTLMHPQRCTGNCGPKDPKGTEFYKNNVEIYERMYKRGLLELRSCDAGANARHPYVTSLGKLAIECHNLANSTLDPTKI